MKFTASLTTVGAILIASASLSFSRALSGVHSTTANLFEDTPDCLHGLCRHDQYSPLEVRVGTPSGAGAAAGEAAGARVPPVVPASEVPGGPGAGTRRPGPEDPQALRPIAPLAPEPVAGSPPEGASAAQSWVRPPGLDGPAESQFWTDTTSRIASSDFNSIKPNEGTILYTGELAWEGVTDFGIKLEAIQPGRPMRHYLNTIKSDPPLQGLVDKLKTELGGGTTKPNGVVSLQLVTMAREIPNEVHVLFNSPEEVTAAVERGEIPKGHLKYYEMYAITSEGTKVPRVLAWDAKTWKSNSDNQDYQPPQIWEQGQPPLGSPADFTMNPRERTD